MDNEKCNQNGVFAKENFDDKVNESNNIQQERNAKSATETAFCMPHQIVKSATKTELR